MQLKASAICYWRSILEPASQCRVAAQRLLRDELRGARSVVWLFHMSDEQQRRSPATPLSAIHGLRGIRAPARQSLPIRVLLTKPVCEAGDASNVSDHLQEAQRRQTGLMRQNADHETL